MPSSFPRLHWKKMMNPAFQFSEEELFELVKKIEDKIQSILISLIQIQLNRMRDRKTST